MMRESAYDGVRPLGFLLIIAATADKNRGRLR
jgi:hypothetical protein